MGDRKRVLHQGCNAGLVLEIGPITEITDSSLRTMKTFLKGNMSRAEAVLCQLAVVKALGVPSSPPMSNQFLASLFFPECAFGPHQCFPVTLTH